MDTCLDLTLFQLEVTPDTTADGAAGIFGLYLMGDTPVNDQVTSEPYNMIFKPVYQCLGEMGPGHS